MDYQMDFGPIAQSRTREIRVSVQEFKGRPVLNIRRWIWIEPYDSDDEAEWRPTKQGVAFAVEYLPDLIAALQEAEAHARAAGLIEDAPVTEAAE